jgi:4-carboxymuconolactone decarboxylase
MTRDIYEDGLTVRRKMLGDAWVDRSLANRNDFNAEIQQQITEQFLLAECIRFCGL